MSLLVMIRFLFSDPLLFLLATWVYHLSLSIYFFRHSDEKTISNEKIAEFMGLNVPTGTDELMHSSTGSIVTKRRKCAFCAHSGFPRNNMHWQLHTCTQYNCQWCSVKPMVPCSYCVACSDLSGGTGHIDPVFCLSSGDYTTGNTVCLTWGVDESHQNNLHTCSWQRASLICRS